VLPLHHSPRWLDFTVSADARQALLAAGPPCGEGYCWRLCRRGLSCAMLALNSPAAPIPPHLGKTCHDAPRSHPSSMVCRSVPLLRGKPSGLCVVRRLAPRLPYTARHPPGILLSRLRFSHLSRRRHRSILQLFRRKTRRQKAAHHVPVLTPGVHRLRCKSGSRCSERHCAAARSR
jgi:hypothetical protein